ncbi:MAG: helix-turn-helix domain-containing protein [Bacteroidetes bacterium]|uniref:Helix-turn-helix domain-containing protein n=1 Tax=Candidatus Cryptobacteroides faecipullorum TaxID=2840764 RepID=A0A9D9I7K1_9BACT|nr:helix-turn-helix domain-containing protein [Candidatus Cryptobacteroides faecipullorum]
MITSEEPKVSATGRYGTMETCRKLGVCKDTLRRYRSEHKIRCGYRKENGKVFYTGAEILRFWRATV